MGAPNPDVTALVTQLALQHWTVANTPDLTGVVAAVTGQLSRLGGEINDPLIAFANAQLDALFAIQEATESAHGGSGAIIAVGGTGQAGITATGGPTNNAGVLATGGPPDGRGILTTGTGSGEGLRAIGGSNSGTGATLIGGAANGGALIALGTGAGHALSATGGSGGGRGLTCIGGGAGDGVNGTGGPTNGRGVVGVGSGTGIGVSGSSATGYGGQFTGNATRAPLRMAPLAAAPSTPATGDMYYDSTTNHFFGWTGAAWIQLDN